MSVAVSQQVHARWGNVVPENPDAGNEAVRQPLDHDV